MPHQLAKHITLENYFVTGTRVYTRTTIKEHLPKCIYKFGRHLRIRYDDNQPIQNLQQQNEIRQEIDNQQNEETQQETELKENNDISDAGEELPRNIAYTQQETPTTNIQQNNNSQQTLEDTQTSEDGHPTSEDEMQTTQT